MVDVSFSLLGGAGWQFFDNSGRIMSGGRLYTYEAGGTTPAATYTSALGTVANANPIILDSAGRPPAEIWLETGQDYKFALHTAQDALIRTYDNVPGSVNAGFVGDLASQGDPSGASLIGLQGGPDLQTYIDGGSASVPFQQSGTAPLAATVQSKARQILNAADFVGFDATGVSLSTDAIQNALDEAADRGRFDVMIPTGAKTGALTIAAGAGLIGPSTKAELVFDAGTYGGITVTGSDVSIGNLQFNSAAKTSGFDIVYDCGSSTLERLRVFNIRTVSSRGMFSDSGSGGGRHIDTKIEGYYSQLLNGPGINMGRMFAYVFVTDVSADYANVSTGNHTGFSFDGSALTGADAGGLKLRDCNVLGGAEAYTTAVLNQRGYNFNEIVAVEMETCKADGCGEYGFLFNDVGGLKANMLTGTQNAMGQIYMDTVYDSVFTNTTTIGRNLSGLAYKPAAKDGIYLNGGCYELVFGAGLSRDNTGDGFNKATAQAGGILVNGLMSKQNVGYGLRDMGDSGFLYVGGAFGGNTAGDYTQSNTAGHIAATQGNSGAIINV